jgi:Txe/YoeB family toxin of Txe-Axe toxin-antitoxin module
MGDLQGPGGRVVRSIHFDPAVSKDFLCWLAADRKTAVRITCLIGEIRRPVRQDR